VHSSAQAGHFTDVSPDGFDPPRESARRP
jgi:hypothetical protein